MSSSDTAAAAPGGVPSRWEPPLAAATAAALYAAFLAVPLLGAIGLPFAAVPVVRVAHRRGGLAALATTGLAAAILFGLALATGGWRPAAGLAASAVAAVGLPGFFAARVRRGADSSRAYLALAIAGGVLLTGLLLALPAAGEPPIETQLRSSFNAMIPAALDSYRRSGADSATLDRARATLVLAKNFTARYWAGLVAGCWVLAAAVGYYTGARGARPAPSAEATRFEGLRIPPGFAAAFVASGAVFALLSDAGRTISGDLLLALGALYFVGGLSIICHFARRWFRSWILRFGLYVLVAYFPMNLGVALLGLFDWYVNFRRRGERA
jgi:hypothetical protein